jgi:hypothetical protein
VAVAGLCLAAFTLVPISFAVATSTASAQTCIPAIPSSCQSTEVAAPLLSQFIDGGNGIYAATDAEYASLVNLENQAVQNTLADHGLPQSDAIPAQTWGRDDALAELWQLIVQAMSTPTCTIGHAPGDGCRTTDQQNAVDWLATVDQRDAQIAAEDAGLEYVKWAGLDQSGYQGLFKGSSFPSQDSITAFLCGGSSSTCPVTPQNFADPVPVSTCTTSENCLTYQGITYAEGFCGYHPPSPFQSDYSDFSNITCTQPCPEGADCVPFSPSYDNFVKWGAADVNNQLFDTPQYAQAVNDVAVGVGFGVGTAAAITALSLAGVALGPTTFAAAGSTALFPFAATIGVTAASVAALALIAIAGAIAVAFFAVDAFNNAAVPGQIAQLVETAHSTTPDLHSMAGDSSSLGGLFSLFMGAAMPTPDPGTCKTIDPATGAPCLNAPSIPAQSPVEQFKVSLNSGSASSPSLGTPVTTPTITWNDKVKGVTQADTAYLSGNWFVVIPSGGTPVQTLRIHYIDWNGTGQTAWLANWPTVGYRFITVPDQSSSSGPPPNPSTCLTSTPPTCGDSASIDYVGTDGKEYSASAYSTLPQLGTVMLSPSSGIVEGSPVTLSVTGSSPDGSALTYTWSIQDKPPNNSGIITLCLNSQLQQVPCPVPTVTLSGNQVTHAFPTSGPFTVTVTATDQNGSTSVTRTVYVDDITPDLLLANENSTVPQTPGTATTVTGQVAHVGSEDVETIHVNWGDGSATDIGSNNCGLSCLLQNVNFGASSPCAANANFTCVPFSDGHLYAQPGVYTVTVTLVDQAGTTDTDQLTEAVLYPTNTTLASGANPSVAGQPVTFTATVTGGDGGGTVAFSDGSNTISGCDAVNLTGSSSPYQAMCTTSGVGAGDVITASYTGDSSTGASSGSVTQTLFLPVTVNGSQTYAGTPTFAPAVNLPPGVILAGGASCTTVNGGTPISASLHANSYTIDAASCFGLLLFGPASPDWVLSYAGGTFAVNKATPVITWANPASIVYGTPLGSGQLDAAANVPGTFAYNPPANTVLSGGLGQTLSTTFTPSDGTDYTQATANAQIDVTRASQSVSFAAGTPTIGTVGESFTPSASASSSLPVSVTVDQSSSAVCSLAPGTGRLTLNAVGTCLLDATQVGNNDYFGASTSLSIAVYLPGTLTYSGALTYKDRGPITVNGLTVHGSGNTVISVSGTITLPGVKGANATVTVAMFSIRGQLQGAVIVRDSADHFTATSTAYGSLTRTSLGEVTGTARGQIGGHAYTLAFTI